MGVSSEQVRSYVDDGFLVLEDLVSNEDLVELEADLVRFARGEYALAGPAPAEDADDDESAMRKVLAIHFPHWVSDVARGFVHHPGIVDVLAAITGAHLPHWDGRVKCMQSMLFVKGPGLPGQAWHQDERFIPTRDRSLVGAWIAVDDATIDNGCIWVVPGSHRDGYLWPTRDHGQVGEFDGADESHGFDETGAVPVEVARGSVVFFNGYLLHRSHRNRTDGFRRALVNHYCNAWSLLPWAPTKTVPGAEIPTLDNRTTVIVAGEDPYEWRGRSEPPARVFLRPYEAGQ